MAFSVYRSAWDRADLKKAFPGNPAGWATINMNTLTEEEMTAVAASGDPVATWPTTPYEPALPEWPWPGVAGGRNPLVPRMTDS